MPEAPDSAYRRSLLCFATAGSRGCVAALLALGYRKSAPYGAGMPVFPKCHSAEPALGPSHRPKVSRSPAVRLFSSRPYRPQDRLCCALPNATPPLPFTVSTLAPGLSSPVPGLQFPMPPGPLCLSHRSSRLGIHVILRFRPSGSGCHSLIQHVDSSILP